MDKISINNLFSSNTDFKPLDVYSLFNSKEHKNKNKLNFNIDRLINLREDRKKKVLVQYEKIFNRCLNKINLTNHLDKLDLVFSVDDSIYGYNDYTSIECLQYLQTRLIKMYFDTLLISNKVIYVSWKNLKKNRELEEKKIEN